MYTSLHSNITNFLLNYHIRVSSIELYVHRVIFYISGQCFVPHNRLIYCKFNIGTAYHLLFIKSPSSEFMECFGKVLYPLKFLQLYPIIIRIWIKWFGWLHTIWIWNSNILLFLFHDFIFHHLSAIFLPVCSCHLCCIGFPFFFQSNNLLPPLHVLSCWYIFSVQHFSDVS